MYIQTYDEISVEEKTRCAALFLAVAHVFNKFMVHYEFKSTLPVFIEEARLLGFNVPYGFHKDGDNINNSNSNCQSNVYNIKKTNKQSSKLSPSPHIRRDDIKKIVNSFETKNYKLFFELWQSLIPNSIKESNIYRELTFYLYIYFATLPFRESHSEKATESQNVPVISLSNEENNNHSATSNKGNDNTNTVEKIVNNINENNQNNNNNDDFDKFNNKLIQDNNVAIPTDNNIETKELNKRESSGRIRKLSNVEHNENTEIDRHDDNISLLDADKDIDVNSNKFDTDSIEDNIELTTFSKIVNARKRKSNDEFDEDSLNIGSIKDEDDEGGTYHNSENEDDVNIKTDEKMLDEKKFNEVTGDDIKNVDIEIIENINSFNDDESVKELSIINEESVEDDTNLITKVTEEEDNESAMDVLRTFLTTKGPEFSSEPDFLPYFALPFINNPHNHPSFMEIFKESWVSNMENKLIDFIQQYSYGNTVTPSLMRLCSIENKLLPVNKIENDNKSSKNNDGKQLLKVKKSNVTTQRSRPTTPHKVATSPRQPDIVDNEKRYKNMKSKFHKLHRDHQNLIGVAAELTAALENSVRGQAVDLKATLNNCVKIFPELFTRSRLNTAEEIIKKDVRLSYQTEEIPCYHLDVQKIKQHLATGSIKAKLLLLQALRWRLTHTTGDERDQVILWISQHDVLSIKYSNQCPVLEEMLITPGTCTPHPLQQAAARLLNTVASLHSGRDYLAQSNNLLILLITTLRQDSIRIDQSTSDMLLAALQKLSLRRNQRLWMIEEGVVQWLVEKLKIQAEAEHRVGSICSSGSYTLEYSTALLMNLTLHEEARMQFIPNTISVIINLLDTPHTQIIPVIAGTLYCLLTKDDINQAAKELELDKTITKLVQKFSNDQSLVRQFETLMRLHKRQLSVNMLQTASEDHNEDETDDPEELEQELDLNDPVRAMPGDLSGDDLLNRLYSCPTSVHGPTASEAAMMSL